MGLWVRACHCASWEAWAETTTWNQGLLTKQFIQRDSGDKQVSLGLALCKETRACRGASTEHRGTGVCVVSYSFQKTKEHREVFEIHYLFCFVFRKHSLTTRPWLTLISKPSCLQLPNAGPADVCHQGRLSSVPCQKHRIQGKASTANSVLCLRV